MKITKEKVVTLFFLAFIFISMLSLVLPIKEKIENSIKEYISNNKNNSFSLKRVIEELKKEKNLIETATEKNIIGRIKYIELYGRFNKIINNTVIEGEDTVVRMNNGYLTYLTEDRSNKTTSYSESIIQLNKDLKERGIEFLYVPLPNKIQQNNKQLPTGVEDYSNENIDQVIQKLEGQVEVLDLRNQIQNYEEAYFRTDHHWKPETAFWAANKIADVLKDRYDFCIDKSKLDKDQYTITTYDDYFLGSQGKKVGLGYTTPEDISILTPNFATQYIYEYGTNTNQKTTKKGNFKEALLYFKCMKKEYYTKNPYLTYLNGDYGWTRIQNSLVEEPKKVLIIKDSFSLPLATYLSTVVQQIDMIDFRYFKGDFNQYLDEFNPDIVIIDYYIRNFGKIPTITKR